MPRIRTVKPEFWSHPIMCRQDDATRLLALALLNYSDDHGYFLADAAAVRSFARPFDDDSTNVRASLEKLGKIDYIRVVDHAQMGPIGWVIKFSSHQRVDRPNPSKLKEYFDSGIVRRLIDERSTEEGKGKEGKGTGKGNDSARSARGTGRKISNSNFSRAMGDSRHERIHQIIMGWYQDWAQTECPWNGAEGSQLKALLVSTPNWPDQQLVTCLENLARSPECVPIGSPPREWLAKLPKFLKGPLDRFWKPVNGNGANGNGHAKSPAEVRSEQQSEFIRQAADRLRVRPDGENKKPLPQ